ncbi:MAG: hypothetical protein ACLSCV_01585 [Acutalibacteraceae bacterium]
MVKRTKCRAASNVQRRLGKCKGQRRISAHLDSYISSGDGTAANVNPMKALTSLHCLEPPFRVLYRQQA